MSSAIQLLIELTIAASVAILLVMLLRKPLRRTFGAAAAYSLWLVVPASQLVVALPAPTMPAAIASAAVSDFVIGAVPAAVRSWDSAPANAGAGAIVLTVWVSGILLMLLLLIRRQWSFMQSLGRTTAAPDGTWRSDFIHSPVLLGIWRPSIILPTDFESRYTAEERTVVLAHEQAHRQRGDVLVNAIAAIWLCLSWFNPLAHWAVGRLRFDQDLACDAAALLTSGVRRRRYGDLLLKAQLAGDAGWPAPAGCHWLSNHPLKERIAMLKRPIPTARRRWLGTALVCVLTAAGSYASWMGMPSAQGQVVTLPDRAQGDPTASLEDPPAPADCSLMSRPCLTGKGLEVSAERVSLQPDGDTLFENVIGALDSGTTRFTARAVRIREGSAQLTLEGAEITTAEHVIEADRVILDLETARLTSDGGQVVLRPAPATIDPRQ